MSRLHPFDVVAAALPDEWFSRVQAAETQGRDTTDRLQFHDLTLVRQVLGQLSPAAGEAPGAVLAEYETLLFVAYRFWTAGRHTLSLDREAIERAVGQAQEAGPDDDAAGQGPVEPPSLPATVPHSACYLQLPERLFWARISDSATPEPLDGLFLASSARGVELTVLAVLGLRPERDGFSQIAVTVPPEDLSRAGDHVRQPLFAPVLEGGARAGVKSLVSDAELLHLANLALAEVAR